VVICLKRGACLRIAQWIPLPLTVSCFSEIQIGFTFLVLAYPRSPGKRAVKRVYVMFALLLEGAPKTAHFSMRHVDAAIQN